MHGDGDLRVGFGSDTHRLQEGLPLRLGGCEIPHTHGLVGHSDADVALHAVADALLGAAALGDIGDIWDDRDPTGKGMSSARILSGALQRVVQAGFRVLNVDLVILAEQPRLGPRKSEMRARMAHLLGVEPGRVNVKAKTGEGLDAVGRGEAISAQAVALLARVPQEEERTP